MARGEGLRAGGVARFPARGEVARVLKREIMLGELAAGDALVELSLAERFGCSQGKVREALMNLQGEGLVERQGYRGTVVSTCTADEAVEMFRIRQQIECRGIRRVLERPTERLVPALRAFVEAMVAAAEAGDELELAAIDRDFHLRIFADAGLAALDPILHRCLIHNHRFKISQSGARRDLMQTALRHTPLVDLIEAGDAEEAERALFRHIATIVDFGPDVFGEALVMTAELAPEIVAVQAAADAANGPLPDPTLLAPAEGRAQTERANAYWNTDLPGMAAAEDVTIPPDATLGTGAIPARRLVPLGVRPGALVYVHGGGFAFCSPATHERCARVLAAETGLTVLVPDYRLAPEHPHPAGLLDTIAAMRAAQDFAAARGALAVAGDSAGANLALAAMLHERGPEGRAFAAAAVLYYGNYDTDFDTPSYRAFAEGPGLTRDKMRRYWDWYLARPEDRESPYAAPLRGGADAFAVMQPIRLIAAAVDPLLSDSLALGEFLGVEITVVSGVTHGFLQMSRDLPQARAALAEGAAFIRKHT